MSSDSVNHKSLLVRYSWPNK